VAVGSLGGPSNHEDSDVVAEGQRANENDPAGSAVVLRHLQKRFGEHRAIRDLSLCLQDGECFGLLGPNGAGKTTTINILAGTSSASAGQAFVGGVDIKKSPETAHRMIGICPQFDVVVPDMTVEDHLGFYARLKGVPSNEITARVRIVASQVGLDGDAFGSAANTLSGGTRRRLSIAIALVGNPRVLILDEPTTGLDPETKHQIWDIIARVRPGRCIILTTHAMEEADALCSRIGIMAQGSLMCVGTQQHLKEKFGDGLRLKLALRSTESSEAELIRLKMLVERICATAKEVFNFGSNRTYILPKASVQLSHSFEELEKARVAGIIRDFALNQTSLEEVFIKLVTDAEAHTLAVNDE